MKGRIYIRTLGCPKNETDGAVLARFLERLGWRVVDDPLGADAEIVNTCGFIEATKLESIEALWEGAARKTRAVKGGSSRRLIATGCLAQRYPQQIAAQIDGLDAVVGFNQPDLIAKALAAATNGGTPACWVPKPDTTYRDDAAPWVFDGDHPAPLSAYVKIGDGCENACRFCAIPSIRGRLRSRPLPSIRDEVASLVMHGTREVILVSQDTTSYGLDWGGQPDLADLLASLAVIPGDFWIRVMYAHPAFLTDRQIAALASDAKIVPYLDLPLQHITDRMLGIMNRHVTRAQIERQIDALRRARPGIALRTTFIVGHPGETEHDFRQLCSFAAEIAFERMGVFVYSPEEGTPAVGFRGQVGRAVAEARASELMAEFDRWSALQSAERIGQRMTCLIEQAASDGTWEGRTAFDAPEIDGRVTLRSAESVRPGLHEIEITAADGVDLVGMTCDHSVPVMTGDRTMSGVAR